MIVLDANILIRAVLGKRVRQLLQDYAGKGARFFAPDEAFHDAARYLPQLLNRRGNPVTEAAASLEYLQQFVEIIEQDLYSQFEDEARSRLRGRDEGDWPVRATALALGTAIWSEDAISLAQVLRSGLRVALRSSSRVKHNKRNNEELRP